MEQNHVHGARENNTNYAGSNAFFSDTYRKYYLPRPIFFADIVLLWIFIAFLYILGLCTKALSGGTSDPDAHPVTLKKPGWTPKMSRIRTYFKLLYLCQGPAIWLVAIDPKVDFLSPAVLLFIAQFAVYLLWPIIFFRWKLFGWAVVDSFTLWILLDFTIYSFWHVNPLASFFMYPYLCWITSALALTIHIWRLNRKGEYQGFKRIV